VFVKMQPCPQKNQKLEEGQNSNEAAGDDNLTTSAFERLGTDEIAFIFGFLPPHDIMPARLNKKTRDAAKTTIVPMSQFLVNSVDEYNYNAMDVMTIALPNLQQIEIGYLGSGHKYIDGEDPDERMAAETINFFSHEIEIISNFKMLRSLVVHFAPLNGRYPCLFNFPLLNKLCITTNWKLKWDLEVLAGLPMLKELYLNDNKKLTGNINSLRVLKDTLAKVEIIDCMKVEGNFMDLADFPHLIELNLCHTAVTGDVREISAHDFPVLKSLSLPKGVYGGYGQEFQSISDAHDTISVLYSFRKQRPPLLKD